MVMVSLAVAVDKIIPRPIRGYFVRMILHRFVRGFRVEKHLDRLNLWLGRNSSRERQRKSSAKRGTKTQRQNNLRLRIRIESSMVRKKLCTRLVVAFFEGLPSLPLNQTTRRGTNVIWPAPVKTDPITVRWGSPIVVSAASRQSSSEI